MRAIALIILILPIVSEACDFSLGAGPTFRASFKGESPSTGGGNVIAAQCAFDKWIIQGDYFSRQTLKDKGLTVHAYPMLTVSHRWSMSPEKTRLPPFFQFGLSVKEPEKCGRNDFSNCNPLVPSPVSATIGIGFTAKKLEFLLRHTSNAGTSKPNFGQDSIILFYRF